MDRHGIDFVNVTCLINYDYAYQTQTMPTDSTWYRLYANVALQIAIAAYSEHNVIQKLPECHAVGKGCYMPIPDYP